MSAWQQTLRNLRALFTSQRKLLIPFLFLAAVEVVLLLLVWLAPHPLFSRVLAPPLRYFFHERSLHYPWHLWLIYYVMKHTHALATLFIGAYMSGLASLMVRQTHEAGSFSLRDAVLTRNARYGCLAMIWAATWLITVELFKAVSHWGLKGLFGLSVLVATMITLQWFFAYPIAAAVFERLSWWKALARGIRESLLYPWSTLGIILPPSIVLIVFAWIANEDRMARWMIRFIPEIVLIFVILRLFLVTLIDSVLTVGIAHLWCIHRAQETQGKP